MPFLNYYINWKNVENVDMEIQLQDLSTLEDPPGDTTNIDLEASDQPAIMDTVDLDDDKTAPIKGRRLTIGFNSDDTYDVDTFSDGDDGRFLTRLGVGTGPDTVPFIGTLVLDDNSELFQPKPNKVTLKSGEGLASLKGVEFTDGDEVAVGHYSIMEIIVLCLDKINNASDINVVFNLYEEDTDPEVTHAFTDIFLDARTFENGAVDKKDDCYTVLQKICYAFGMFVTFDADGWWFIRWDEYDVAGAFVTSQRVANFSNTGVLTGYSVADLTKHVAHDATAEYMGYRLSNDNAVKRFQRRAHSVTHSFKLEQPIEVPCNSGFTRGTPDDTVKPLLTFIPECWTHRRGWPNAYETPSASVEIRIAVTFDANDYEDERYVYLTPFSGTGVDSPPEYLESEAIEVEEKDKIEVSIKWRLSTFSAGLGNNHSLMRVRLDGNDGSYWLLGNETILDDTTPLKWYDTSVFTANTGAGDRVVDTTVIDEEEWQSIDLGESPPLPVTGKIYIMLEQFNQTVGNDDITVHYSDLRVTYIPYIAGSYHKVTSQEHKVTGDNDSRKNVTHEMFISDGPKPILKGVLKKFDGSNYVLTGNWSDYVVPATLPDSRLAKHIVFQWWNQFRKTRTVIETDIQGLRDQDDATPSLIHRWKIYHEDQEDKYFMLTSFRNMNFYLCEWTGVFVETSDLDGDRVYTDTWEFKYIQGDR